MWKIPPAQALQPRDVSGKEEVRGGLGAANGEGGKAGSKQSEVE